MQFSWLASRVLYKKSVVYKGLGYRLYKGNSFIIVKASYNTILSIIIPYLTFCKIKKKRWVINFYSLFKTNLVRFARSIIRTYPLNDYKFLGFKFRTKKKFKIGKKARY